MDYKQRLQACLNRVICDPGFTPAELDHWFCPDYVQLVDDQRLDRAAFEQHLLALHQSPPAARSTLSRCWPRETGCTPCIGCGPGVTTAPRSSAR